MRVACALECGFAGVPGDFGICATDRVLNGDGNGYCMGGHGKS